MDTLRPATFKKVPDTFSSPSYLDLEPCETPSMTRTRWRHRCQSPMCEPGFQTFVDKLTMSEPRKIT